MSATVHPTPSTLPGPSTPAKMSAAPPREGFSYRSALALAEALIPGAPTIPGADEATVARAEEVVRDFHPALTLGWRAAQAALAAAAVARTGRSFDALSAARQQELLTSWESDPLLRMPLALIGIVYKFVH